MMSGVDFLIANHAVDRNRVGTTGHSYGGIMTNWLITRYKDRFRAAVSGAGESNWTSNFALSDISRTKETEFFGRPWEPRAREIMIAQSPYLNSGGVKAATDYNMFLSLNGSAATLTVNNQVTLTHTFPLRTDAIGIQHAHGCGPCPGAIGPEPHPTRLAPLARAVAAADRWLEGLQSGSGDTTKLEKRSGAAPQFY